MIDELLRQKIETLDGSRRLGESGRAAVRFDDLNGLLALPEKLKSVKAAGSTPTQAEFDALVDDVYELHRRLLNIVGVIRTKRGR